MTTFYQDKKNFLNDINDLITTNSGKTIPLTALELKFGLKYGFGKVAIIKALKTYETIGQVSFDEKDNIIIAIGH